MTRLTVPDMSCGHCKSAIERRVAHLDPDARTAVDLDSKTVDVESTVSDAALLEALADEGYPATVQS